MKILLNELWNIDSKMLYIIIPKQVLWLGNVSAVSKVMHIILVFRYYQGQITKGL